MSYAQRKEISGNRTLAIILVAVIQLGLGYAIVQIAPPAPPTITQVISPVIPPVAPAPPAPPPPPPPKKIEPARARGDVRMLFSDSDYPASAQAAGAQGTAQASLTIGPDGRVVGCSLVRSTGNGALDAATCNILRRRAKFTPAHDSSGAATTDTYTTPPITWRLAEE